MTAKMKNAYLSVVLILISFLLASFITVEPSPNDYLVNNRIFNIWCARHNSWTYSVE